MKSENVMSTDPALTPNLVADSATDVAEATSPDAATELTSETPQQDHKLAAVSEGSPVESAKLASFAPPQSHELYVAPGTPEFSVEHTQQAPQQPSPVSKPTILDQRPLYLAIAALVVSIVTWVWVVLVPTVTDTDKPVAPSTTTSTTQQTTPPPVPSLAPTGQQIVPPNLNADASALIVNPQADAALPLLTLHADYQCPICRQAETIWGETITTLVEQGRIRVEHAVRSFLDVSLRTDSSRRAAVAASCADTVGAFAGYHAAVFAGQPAQEGDGYTDQQLRETFAAQAGITGANLTEFQQCFDSLATLDVVNNMEAVNMRNPLVTGTPTFLVNGKLLDLNTLPVDLEGFMAAVEALAAQA
ncbi:MAG: DsbA family protein [Propionibacteriaceae bacterium]|nr:DsbA family protein [Propionibacteriaceae bacterium]